MPIEKGKPWGDEGEIPMGTPVVDSDAKAAGLWAAGFNGIVALSGGDMCKTLGGRGDIEQRIGRSGTILPIDVGECVLEGITIPFIAHVVARGHLWGGECMVAMNAEWIGRYRLAPRGHPGDGRLDVTVGSMRPAERLKARSRAATGDHVPHPDLTTSRQTSVAFATNRSRRIYVDGQFIDRCASLTLRLHPAALRVVV